MGQIGTKADTFADMSQIVSICRGLFSLLCVYDVYDVCTTVFESVVHGKTLINQRFDGCVYDVYDTFPDVQKKIKYIFYTAWCCFFSA